MKRPALQSRITAPCDAGYRWAELPGTPLFGVRVRAASDKGHDAWSVYREAKGEKHDLSSGILPSLRSMAGLHCVGDVRICEHSIRKSKNVEVSFLNGIKRFSQETVRLCPNDDDGGKSLSSS